MIKIILKPLALLTLLIGFDAFAFQYDESIQSVGKVFSSQNAEAPCSGVLIHSQIVLTALHCIGNETGFATNIYFEDVNGFKTKIKKFIYPDQPKSIKEIWQDSTTFTKDFAILILEKPTSTEPAKMNLDNIEIQITTNLTSFGFPNLRFSEPLLFSSQCSPQLDHPASKQHYLIVRCVIAPGMSGGGVFLQTSEGNTLVGINQSGGGSRKKGTMGGIVKISGNPLFQNIYSEALREVTGKF